VERVDHVDIFQIGGRCFISQVDRMLQRKIPDRKCFKFCIAGIDSSLVLVIELGKAGGHFTRTRARRRHDDQRVRGFDIVIFPVAFVADDERDVVGVAVDDVVQIDVDAVFLKMVLEKDGGILSGELCDDDGADEEAAVPEFIHQTQDVRIVGDPEIAADFVLDDILCGNDDDDFRLILKLHQHAQLGIRFEAGKYAGSMVVVEKLPSELQIQLAAELTDSFPNVFRLSFQVLFIAETDLHCSPPSSVFIIQKIGCACNIGLEYYIMISIFKEELNG
jgi:hypothetical protein